MDSSVSSISPVVASFSNAPTSISRTVELSMPRTRSRSASTTPSSLGRSPPISAAATAATRGVGGSPGTFSGCRGATLTYEGRTKMPASLTSGTRVPSGMMVSRIMVLK